MNGLIAALGSFADLLLAVFAFGLIIVIHELGHFLAARWAGIRVLAFAVGFGPAIVSFRKGLGWRRGSSEAEYREALHREALQRDALSRRAADSALDTAHAAPAHAAAISPTEYRLNWFPLGGYVKMLGQEDANPGAVSNAPDSYQSRPVWRRMVVISAGVIANIFLAAALFIIVFMVGLRTEPPVVGDVAPDAPAARAVAINAPELGLTDPGLKPGDLILRIDRDQPRSFSDLGIAVAMARGGEAVHLAVRREGIPHEVYFSIRPEVSPLSGLLDLGVEPARSTTVASVPDALRPAFDNALASVGLPGVEPGMRLVRAGDLDTRSAADLRRAVRDSQGRPVPLVFERPDGSRLTIDLAPRAELQRGLIDRPSGAVAPIDHLLGLTPVLMVRDVTPAAQEQGLLPGDVFVRLGGVEFPSVAQGIGEIRARRGGAIDAVVMRTEGERTVEVPLKLRVNRQGQVGFAAGDTARDATLVSLPPAAVRALREGAQATPPPAHTLALLPGTRILSVNGAGVTDFASIRAALLTATDEALRMQAPSVAVPVVLQLPYRVDAPDSAAAPARAPTQATLWHIPLADVQALHTLGWTTDVSPALFDVEQFLLKADGPLAAVRTGVAETHRVMVMTYLTFVRLFEGTVKVEHLKGPVGIAHAGALIADRGLIWLLFFMALISVNLAVVNFLPLPIVDGGQFIFLCIEGLRGKPVPIPVQNAATMIGLLLIGSMFIIVTFNDVVRLISG